MSKYKEQRLQQIEGERQQRAKRRRWMAAVAVVVTLSAGAAIWHRNANATKENAAMSRTPTDGKWTLAALLALKLPQIEELDIGLTNLLCAEGLRGSENLDLDKSLDRLDEMAARVRLETDRNMHRFRANPAEYENSEPYYRMLMLVTVLQQDFGSFTIPTGSLPSECSSQTKNSSRIRATFSCTDSRETPNQEPARPCPRFTSPLVGD